MTLLLKKGLKARQVFFIFRLPTRSLITPGAFLAVFIADDKAQHDLVGIIGIGP